MITYMYCIIRLIVPLSVCFINYCVYVRMCVAGGRGRRDEEREGERGEGEGRGRGVEGR